MEVGSNKVLSTNTLLLSFFQVSVKYLFLLPTFIRKYLYFLLLSTSYMLVTLVFKRYTFCSGPAVHSLFILVIVP